MDIFEFCNFLSLFAPGASFGDRLRGGKAVQNAAWAYQKLMELIENKGFYKNVIDLIENQKKSKENQYNLIENQ